MTEPPIPDLPTQILALGREGLAPVEIAAALGLGVGELEGMGRADAAVDLALHRAEAAALAWWAALPREAMANGARFNGTAWRATVAWLTFEAGQAPAAKAAAPAAPVRPRARYEIPCNGTTKLLANGMCPYCGKFHRGTRRPWREGDPEAWKRGARRNAARSGGNDSDDNDN